LRKTAQEEEARILGGANKTSAEKLQTIKEQIQKEASVVRQALRSETEALAKDIAVKVLGRVI
jgi:F0F1-type ATP synthase membrane subunit b/b'